MRKLSDSKGFSLIELLTVIAIIAILAAVIFPVMGAVKERARRNQCMTNLHQIAVGVQMFKTDNRRYPLVLGSEVYGPAGSDGTRTRYTQQQVSPDMFENVKDAYLFAEYVPTINGFHCPSAQTTNSKDVAVYDQTAPSTSDKPGLAVYAYDSYDCAVIGPGVDKGGYKEFRESDSGNRVERHYWTSWAATEADVDQFEPYPIGSVSAAERPAARLADYARQLRFRNPPQDTVVTWCSYHEGVSKDGKSLVVFLDGHADMLPAREMVECKWRVRPRKS